MKMPTLGKKKKPVEVNYPVIPMAPPPGVALIREVVNSTPEPTYAPERVALSQGGKVVAIITKKVGTIRYEVTRKFVNVKDGQFIIKKLGRGWDIDTSRIFLMGKARIPPFYMKRAVSYLLYDIDCSLPLIHPEGQLLPKPLPEKMMFEMFPSTRLKRVFKDKIIEQGLRVANKQQVLGAMSIVFLIMGVSLGAVIGMGVASYLHFGGGTNVITHTVGNLTITQNGNMTSTTSVVSHVTDNFTRTTTTVSRLNTTTTTQLTNTTTSTTTAQSNTTTTSTETATATLISLTTSTTTGTITTTLPNVTVTLTQTNTTTLTIPPTTTTITNSSTTTTTMTTTTSAIGLDATIIILGAIMIDVIRRERE